ncbi:MAG: PD40 domain-containing protein [Planctomycetia bacterium]|nr:PD40 domain-containing protein [Planctomycetia bacterium]
MPSSSSLAMQRLTHDGQRKLAPAFIDAREIAVAVHASPNLVAIHRVRIEDGALARLHPTVAAHQFDPAFSRDGRYHAYSMSSTSPQLVLVIQDLRDKREHTFRPRDARATARSPSFSPDGSRIVFSLSDVNGHQIAGVNREGEDLRLLTRSTGLNTSPAFSPDGRQIAFSSSRTGDFEIYVMDADGANVRQMTDSPGLDTRPAWSPDGRRIAFTSNREGVYQIYVMQADGTAVRRVGSDNERHDFAGWHPDGERLLVVAERGGMSDLYLVEAPA